MKNHLLISNQYKMYGWVIFLAAVSCFIFCYQIYPNLNAGNENFEISSWEWTYRGHGNSIFNNLGENIQKELITSLILIGLMMICFSREKNEDEYISLLRLRSWQSAVLISYGILFLANLMLYGYDFLSFMLYNMLLILIVFIAKFNFSLFVLKKDRSHNEK